MKDLAIECLDLRRVFTSRSLRGGKQEFTALAGIHLEVPRGIVFGLLGPNGAGKTTTVRILSTLLTPTSGVARVLGFDVTKDTSQVRSRIGFVLGGDRGVYGRLTGIENLKYFGALNHMKPEECDKRAEELLSLVGLFDRRNDLVERYSRGMKQRLHLARGLLTNPEVIFLDEPTIGLDPIGALEIRKIIPMLAKQGTTVLLTTHYMFEADALCESLALINKGEIVAHGAPSEIKNRLSGVRVIELQLRDTQSNLVEQIQALPGVLRASLTTDGLLQRLSIEVRTGFDAREAVTTLALGSGIESVMEREPTLEEAYLEILGGS